MRKLLSCVLLAIFALALAGNSFAKCTVSGTVTDSNGAPFSGATVFACVATIYGCNWATTIQQTTDSSGNYSFSSGATSYPPFGAPLSCDNDYWIEATYPGQIFSPGNYFFNVADGQRYTGIDFQQN